MVGQEAYEFCSIRFLQPPYSTNSLDLFVVPFLPLQLIYRFRSMLSLFYPKFEIVICLLPQHISVQYNISDQ